MTVNALYAELTYMVSPKPESGLEDAVHGVVVASLFERSRYPVTLFPFTNRSLAAVRFVVEALVTVRMLLAKLNAEEEVTLAGVPFEVAQ